MAPSTRQSSISSGSACAHRSSSWVKFVSANPAKISSIFALPSSSNDALVEDHLEGLQQAIRPIAADLTEETMFDRVPFSNATARTSLRTHVR